MGGMGFISVEAGRRRTCPGTNGHQTTATLQLPAVRRTCCCLCCCAPCSGEPLRAMGHGGIRPVVYFYNPNIHPRAEYERRRDCMRNYCEKMGIEFVEGPYDSERWFARTAGMEAEPERGRRCGECFAMRLERAAKFAAERGLDVMACTLGISRFKDMDQVNAAGRAAALGVEGVEYWPQNWRKGGGSQRMYEISPRGILLHAGLLRLQVQPGRASGGGVRAKTPRSRNRGLGLSAGRRSGDGIARGLFLGNQNRLNPV